MNEELKIIIRAVTDTAKKEIENVKKQLDGLSKGAKESGGKMSAAFKGMAKGAAIAVAGVAAIGAALVALGKNTLDTQKEFAKLNAAFDAAGASAGQAQKTYIDLYKFMGDSGAATEAAQSLANLTTNEKELDEWTKILMGTYATFGTQLPTESIAEAIDHTAQLGEVQGSMADVLERQGITVEAYNAKLATLGSTEERAAYIRSTLNSLYGEAAEIYMRNNQALLEYNESQAKLDISMSAAGKAVLPLMTALNNLGSAFFDALKPALDAIIPPIATFVNWIAKAIQSVLSFFSALTGKSSTIKAVGEIGTGLTGAAKGAQKLGSNMKGAEDAAGGAAKAAEEAKKSTQGFDELNIVSSGKSSSGGSGGSGGGGSGAGAGVIDNVAFGTEVEEAEGTANSLADSIKETFGKLAEVFAPSISAWSGAFDTVKESWNNAKPSFINGAIEIKNGFVSLTDYLGSEFIPNIVNTFSVNLAPVFGDVFGFIIEEAGKQFDWLGGYVNTTVNDVIIPALKIVETTTTDVFNIIGANWQEHGASLLEAFSGFFESIRGHLDNFYNSIFKPIWDKVVEVFNWVWEEGLKPLYDKFVDAILVIGTELLTLYNAVIAPVVDWLLTNIFPIVVNVVNGLIETVGGIFIAVTKFIGGIIDALKGIIQFIVGVFTGDWGKAWEGIKNIVSGIWDALKAIFEALWEILKGIVGFVTDVLVAAFEIAWEAIKFVWEQVVAFFQTVWDGICDVFSAVGSWFSDIFKGAWEGIKSAWSSVTGWFKGVWEGIKSVFSSVATFFKDIFSKAWSAVLGVFSATGQVFKGIAEGILNVFKKVVNFLIDGINKVVALPFKGLNSILSRIQNLSFLGISPFKWLSWRAPVPQIPHLAKGGVIDSATIAMIGEAGKEAVVPLENNTQWMDKLAERLAAKSQTPSKIILKVGEKELGWATIDAINGITEQTGGLQLAL